MTKTPRPEMGGGYCLATCLPLFSRAVLIFDKWHKIEARPLPLKV